MGQRLSKLIRLAVALALLWQASQAAAVDVAIMSRSTSACDLRLDYAAVLLRTVLERTQAEFGPYRIETANVPMNRSRLLSELRQGKSVNITPMAVDAQWAENMLPVNIPIDLDLQSWRLLMINGRSQARLSELALSGKLWQAYAGVSINWALYPVLAKQGYRTVTGNNYEGMFLMLQAGRFDYLPRGIPEIFLELECLPPHYADLTIQDSVVLHVPIPTLFFISPQARRLHRRIATGMEAMLRDGSLERLVLAHFRPALERANLCNRIRVEVPNPDLHPALAAKASQWMNPYDPRHGLCRTTPHAGPDGAEPMTRPAAKPARLRRGETSTPTKDMPEEPRIAALHKAR